MKISVNKYTLEPATVDGGTAGSHGMESLEFDFSPEWNDLSRTVTFFPPKSVAKCVSFAGNTVPLPPEVTKRAGRTSFVLCGAKDGAAVITLTGVVVVAESLLPDEAQTTEHTPGALEQAALLCAEARADAKLASTQAEGAILAKDEAVAKAQEVDKAYGVITDIYESVLEGTAVHGEVTDANRLDRAHPVSLAGGLEYLEHILGVICPLRIKVADELPENPSTDTIYIVNGEPMVYAMGCSDVKAYCWTPSYTDGGGPAQLYTDDSSIVAGTSLYWCGFGTPTSFDQLTFFDTVIEVSGDNYVLSQYGSFTAILSEELTLTGSSTDLNWKQFTASDQVTPYLMDNPGRWAISGGGA